jgi:hypothetical protein
LSLRSRILGAALGLAAAAGVPNAWATAAAPPPPTLSAFATLAPDPAAALAAAAADAPAADPAASGEPAPKRRNLSGALKSLAIPGWGQYKNGHRTQAAIFGLLEVGTWASFVTLRTQGALRQDTSFDTARLFAGIDLEDKPERLRRLVGQYQSSDVYNQYVVRREAAFFVEGEAEQQAYIAEHSIPADQAWAWTEFDDFVRYREARRTSELAFQRSRYALGFALVNRLVSAVAAARTAPKPRAEEAALPGQVRGSVEWGLVPGRDRIPESRLGVRLDF